MGLTYTRSEIRTEVGNKIRDVSGGLHSNAKKNRVINNVHSDFVRRTECNRNVLVFSLADAASDGVIEYDKNGNAPAITLVDVEGRNYYTIDNCTLIDSISRWDDDEGSWKQLSPKTQFEIDQEGLLLSTDTIPTGYQQLDSPDTFQILPALATTGYTYKFEVRYREDVRDLMTFSGSPTDSTVVQTTGSGTSDFTAAVTAVKIPCKFRITILTKATPDTVKTEKDIYDGNGWVTVTASEALTGTAQTLAHGATYTATAFNNTHTVGDVFEFAVDDLLVPSCPLQFRQYIIPGVVAELLRIERDREYQTYMMQFEQAIVDVKGKARRLNSDKAPRIFNPYSGAGS